MCRMCECYIGDIVAMDVIWRPICVNVISGRVCVCLCNGSDGCCVFCLY